MKKLLVLGIVAVIIAIVAGFMCFKKYNVEDASEKTTIKIGVTLPLTGDVGFVGQTVKTGMEMTLSNEKSKELKHNYELVFENNYGTPAKTASTTNKLVSVDKVNAVMSIWSPMSGVAAAVTAPKKILSMVCSWEDEALLNPYTFNVMATNEQMVGLLIKTLKDKGVQKIAILTDNSGEFFREKLEEKLKDADIKIVFNEKTNMGHNDFRIAIVKAEQDKPDMYVVIGFPPVPFIFTKQLLEITGKAQVTGLDIFEDMAPDQRYIAEGLWNVDSNTHGNDKFIKDLLAKGYESQSCVGNLSAGLQILVNAFENAPDSDSDSVAKYIKDNVKKFDTVVGEVNISEDNNINVLPKIKIIKDGKTVLVD